MERRRLLRMLALAPRRSLGALAAGLLATVAAPVVTALAVGWLVGVIVAGVSGPAGLVLPVIALGTGLVAGQLGSLVSETAGVEASRQIDRRVRRQVRQVALAHTRLTKLADPAYQDELHRASDLGVSWRVRSPGTAATGQLVLIFRLATALAVAGVVARFSILLALWLLAIALLMRAIVRTQWLQLAVLDDRAAAEKRQVAYWAELATTAAAGKEVRLFGLGDWVTERQHATEQGWVWPIWRVKHVVYRRQAWLFVLAAGLAASALLPLGLAALHGSIEIEKMAAYLVAAWATFGISATGPEAFDIERGIKSVHALDRLVASTDLPAEAPAGARAADARTADRPPSTSDYPPSITFVQVGFSYSGIGPLVLDGLDAEIRPGEVVAVVGANGAGKTSMMKLMAGLYPPVAGRIIVDGQDLVTIPPELWRRRLSFLFQDFIRYPMSAEMNVMAGAGGRLRDDSALRAALRDAGAERLVRDLPRQERTQLTRLRSDGVDLSGGQWQRLALARVLYALRTGAQVLVFDEPTAHLDVSAEAAFFDEVIAAAEHASVVLISHRLSTVRQADRILLLSGGRITEAGTHDELLSRDGEYARLFHLQAARFREPGAGADTEAGR